MLVDKILEGISKEEAERVRMNPVRMSSGGHCARKIGYQMHGYPAEPIPARGLMVFRLGDTIESEIKALIQKYCPEDYLIEYPKDPISVTINGVEVQGHVDGVIKLPSPAVLEIKSINTLGFKRLATEGISYDYRCQATFYMKALKLQRTVFIFYDKNTSHIEQFTYEYDPKLWEEIEQRFQNVLKSEKDNLPEREFGPNEKGKLPWQCSYCSFNKDCWPEAETVFEKGKPQMFIRQAI